MNNNTIATPIVDRNGKQTTVHKRNGVPASSGRIKDVPAPRVTAPTPTYVAPRTAAMAKEVRYNGEVMTWGEVLESINAVGVRSQIIFGEQRRTYSAVHGNNPSTSTQIPAAIMKESGLPDVTDPIQKAGDDFTLAHIKWEKLMAEIPASLYGSTSASKWHDAANEQAAITNAAERKYDDMRRDVERDILDAGTTQDVENMLYDQKGATRFKVEAMLDYAIDNDDTELTKKIANAHIRSYLGTERRDALLIHPDEGVRAAFLEGNNNIPALKVFEVIEADNSSFVASCAEANLAQRGISISRANDGSVTITTKK